MFGKTAVCAPSLNRTYQQPSLSVAGFAAQSLLAALGSIQFVSNVFFAWFVLKEKVSCCALCVPATVSDERWSWLKLQKVKPFGWWKPNGQYRMRVQATGKVLAATTCIVGGCLLLVIYGNHLSDTLTVKDMVRYYNR